MHMVSQRIAFRTDANSEIGTGHFMRCLTLADELKKRGSEVCFVARGLPAHLVQMLNERSFASHALPENTSVENIKHTEELKHSKWLKVTQQQDALYTLEKLGKGFFDWIIVDHYALDMRWEAQIRSIAKKIMVIDDLADRRHDCDILLDQNLHHDMNVRYLDKVPQNCQQLLGPTNALLREEFREERKLVEPRTGDVKNVLVFFGGVDEANLTGMTLKALIALDLRIHVDVVIGQQHPKCQEIKEMCTARGFKLYKQPSSMAILMAKADLSIGAGGASNWERCYLGLPTIVIASAFNQISISNELGKIGACNYIGYVEDINFLKIKNTINDLLYSKKLLRNMSSNAMDLVDGNGVFGVIKRMSDNDY